MKLKFLLIVLVMFLSISSFAQEGWFKQKINDKVTVNFPLQPKQLIANTYGVKAANGSAFLVAVVDVLKATGLHLAAFNTQVETEEFAAQFLAGLTLSLEKFSFAPVKIVRLKEVPTYQIVGTDIANNLKVFINIYFVDGISYNLTCYMADGTDPETKNTFLNNISIAKS